MLRYFILDFVNAAITIKYNENDHNQKNWHQLAFRDIIECSRLEPTHELETYMKSKNEFKIPFYLKTN